MKQKNRKRILRFLVLSCSTTILFASVSIIEQKFIPSIREISHIQCKSAANQIIDDSATKIIEKMDMEHAPLLFTSENNTDFKANTALINQFCALFSSEITKALEELPNEHIDIPIGAVTNLYFLANTGPEIPFTLMPVGAAKVDYESDFISVGINQINYKIWLNISIQMKIVNPLYQETLTLERKIMLVDIIFSGKVPEHYFQMTSPGEYLLTE